jgi:ATP-dependent DNA helicase RecG
MPRRPAVPLEPSSDAPGASRPASPGRAAAAGRPKKAESPLASRSGPARAMHELGLRRDVDRALHLPLRYEDETRLVPVAALRAGDHAQVEGVVERSEVLPRGRRQLIATLAEPEAGSRGARLTIRLLNFYPSQLKQLRAGARLRVRGEVRGGLFGLEMVHPTIREVEPGTPLASALTPIYPTVAALPQAYLRRAIEASLARADLDEILPEGLWPGVHAMLPESRRWPRLRDAVSRLHRPAPEDDLEALIDGTHPARRRLAFDELVAQQLSQGRALAIRRAQRAPALPAGSGLVARLRAVLPFALTGAQERVFAEIAADLARAVPMHRLLQGDVGAGKTVIAALAAAQAIDAGWQCALMAPTEILAEQHFAKLVGWLEPLGVEVAWLTGGRSGRARHDALAAVAAGRARLVVGTHAIIQSAVRFERLGLAIVDEQHRFGVAQRLALREKLGAGPGDDGTPWHPHLLGMSATPIPRTLAMALFADLDVSTIDELPPGRTPIATRVFDERRRDEVIDRVRDEVARGRQVYWVCPLVEPGEHVDDDAADDRATRATRPRRRAAETAALELRNATETHRELGERLPGVMVGLLHGRMPAREKAAVMSLFAGGQMGVLVATTVIEVGVDVPNASVMVIEHAERFGLAQLHQLRGRVGRGAAASVCVLLYTAPLSPTAKARLKAIASTHDGFEIARQDLALRGPGELLGPRQSGAALLRFADLGRDEALIAPARAMAQRLLAEDPAAAARQVERFHGGQSAYLQA